MRNPLKKKLNTLIVLAAVGWLFCFQWAQAADPSLDWKTFETDHFEIHYPSTLEHLVQTVAYESEQAHTRLVPYLNWTPKRKTQVVMSDDFDPSNGSATPIPNNTMMLIMQPPTDGELADYDSWLRLLITHEYAHILHIDKALGIPSGLRNVFGRFLLFFPNLLHPNWFQEGFATFVETDQEKGIGRGQSDVFQMMMRQETIHGYKTLGQVNTIGGHEWPFNHAYLYGVHFMQFMEDVYGKGSVQKLIRYYSDNILPFRVDSNPRSVTGKSLSLLWPEFERYLQGRYEPQITRISSQTPTSTQLLVEDGLMYGSPRKAPDGAIWFSGRDGYSGPMLYRSLNGKTEAVVRLNSQANISISASGDVVLSQLEYCDRHRLYYDLYKLQDDQLVRLTTCGRYRQVEWTAENELIALRFEGAIPSLVLLNAEGQEKNIIWTGRQGDVVGSFAIGEQSQLVASIKFDQTSWDLYQLKAQQWDAITRDAEIQMSPRIYGDQLYFVEANKGQLDVYTLPMAGGAKRRLTNLMTGASEVEVISDQQLVISEYTHEGYRISSVEIPAGINKRKFANQPAQAFRGMEPVVGTTQSYSPVSTLLPTFWLPAFSSGDINSFGAYTQGNDAVGFHAYTAQIQYAPDYEDVLTQINYAYAGSLLLSYNKFLTKLDVIGGEQFDIAKEQEDISVAYLQPFVSMSERVYGFAGAIKSNTRVIAAKDENINIVGNTSWTEDWYVGGLIYDSLSSDVFQGDFSRGLMSQFNVETASLGTNEIEDGEVYLLDTRLHLPVFDTHVLSQRLVVGLGEQSNSDFELGGAMADSYIGPSIQLNKRNFALRGYPEGEAELSNDQMAIYSLEYRLPFTWKDNSIMVPPLGFQGWSSRLFIDSGAVWVEGERPEKAYTGLGGEIIMDTTAFYFLPFRLRLGVAQGLEEIGELTGYIQAGGAF